ncbi:MAG: hypothetical protein ACRYE9_03945 [Janthinobacterium lividum]
MFKLNLRFAFTTTSLIIVLNAATFIISTEAMSKKVDSTEHALPSKLQDTNEAVCCRYES